MLICTVLSLLLLYWFLAFFHNYDKAKVYKNGVFDNGKNGVFGNGKNGVFGNGKNGNGKPV